MNGLDDLRQRLAGAIGAYVDGTPLEDWRSDQILARRIGMADAILSALSSLGLTPDAILAIARGEAVVCPKEPRDAQERAMSGSVAHDDEGDFPRLGDLLDFSGENKLWTVLRQAYRDAIAASPYVPAKKDDSDE